MNDQKAAYYQFHPELKYQVYLKFEDEEVEKRLSDTLDFLGFFKVENDQAQAIVLNRNETKILKISQASPRVAKQIQTLSASMDHYGPESLSSHGGYKVYRYQSAGMMVFDESSYSWEMGLVKIPARLEEIKVMLIRFVSWALASKGVVGFWAVPVEQGFVVM
ncbi:MAG: hypothetical protein WEB87_04700, partial [Bacteriovoracaceae bacterium]